MHVRPTRDRAALAAVLFPTLLFAALLPAVVLASPAMAAPGDLDPAFGGDGRVITDLGSDEELFDMAVQPDGRIVAVGSTGVGANLDFLVVRYNPDGSLDPSFGGDGTVRTDFGSGAGEVARAVVAQPDGRVVVAGSAGSVLVARYNPDGSLDRSFGDDGTAVGLARAAANDVAIQADGKIIVAGTQSFGTTSGGFLARFNADGSLDPTFGFGGTVGDTTWENVALAVQPDGKVVVAGHARYGSGTGCFVFSDYVLERRNPDGSLDTTFDGDGTFRTNFGYTFQSDFCGGPGGDAAALDVAVQPDGRTVAAARVGPGYLLVRHDTDGSLDPTFGGDGTVGVDFTLHALAVHPDGRIVAAGGAGGNFALARYRPDGSLDTTFDGDGTVRTDFDGDDSAMAVAVADGKVVAGGTTRAPDADFALARYLGAGSPAAVCGSPATVVGTPGNDRLVGTAGDDVIAGLAGGDVIDGHGGDDVICGGEGNDVIDGGAGRDFLDGGVLDADPTHPRPDHDRLTGGPGSDILWSADFGWVDANGGPGDDLIHGIRGDDFLEGGPGDDTIDGREGNDFLDGGVHGPDPADARPDRDRLTGGPGADTLWSADVGRVDADGEAGRDTVHGLIGDDVLVGGSGPDRVLGGAGDDRIDVVDSRRGNDFADGDAGSDTCAADPGDVLVSCP